MKVFITGGSGFLGQVTLRHLVGLGHEVHAMARSKSSSEKISAAGALPMQGDMDAAAKLDLRGFDAVVHAAAPVEFWGPWPRFEAEIVTASLNLYKRAAECGVKRFVYISSESVLQDKGSLLDVDESHPYPEMPNSVYGRSKKAAEQALLAAYRQTPGCEPILLRPTFIWGQGVPALQTMVDKVKSGQFAWIDHGEATIEMVHVENVAHAIACALDKGTPGGIYNVTDGTPQSARQFLGALIASAGVPVPAKSIPGRIARPLAATVEALWKLLDIKRPPPLCRFDLAFVAQPRRYKIDRARAELGYTPRAFKP